MSSLLTPTKRRTAVLLAVLGVALGVALGPAPSALAADGQVATYEAKGTIDLDGTLHVVSTLTFDGAPPASLRQVIATTERTNKDTEYRYTVTDVTVTAGSAGIAAQITQGPSTLTLDIPTQNVSGPLVISYVVKGAAIEEPTGGTVVRWPLLQGLSVPVQTFTATVSTPTQFDQLDCAAGAAEAPDNCSMYSGGKDGNMTPTFQQNGSRAGDVVVVTLGFPAGQVAVNSDVRQLWTVARAFSVAPLPLAVSLGLLLLGGVGLWFAHRRTGRDAFSGAEPVQVADFVPVAAGRTEFRVLEGVRPGAVGTLADERVDPIDITATILDLAVRGNLRITELAKDSAHAATDWTFARLDGDTDLEAYEHTLRDAIAPVQGEPVRLSNLRGSIGPVIGDVQSQLYDEVVARGWFAQRPDATRNKWAALGWVALVVAVVAAVVLAAFTSFGLLGIVLVALALGLVAISREMPARTAKGSAVLSGLAGLHANLLTHPTANLAGPDVFARISAVLPYAVVLGGRERWLQAMAAADGDDEPDSTDLNWYHGPEGWQLSDLPASLDNFITTVQGTLFSR
jgi:hypothetical protein